MSYFGRSLRRRRSMVLRTRLREFKRNHVMTPELMSLFARRVCPHSAPATATRTPPTARRSAIPPVCTR